MSLMVEWPALMASTLASGSLAAVHVDADHGKTRLGKGHGQGQAHIAQADACTEPCAVLSLSKGRSDGYMCSMVFDFGEKLFFHYNHGFLGFCNHEFSEFHEGDRGSTRYYRTWSKSRKYSSLDIPAVFRLLRIIETGTSS